MTDPAPLAWRVSIARPGTYAAARQKPETRDFPTEVEAKAYAAEMKAKGAVVGVAPKPAKRSS